MRRHGIILLVFLLLGGCSDGPTTIPLKISLHRTDSIVCIQNEETDTLHGLWVATEYADQTNDQFLGTLAPGEQTCEPLLPSQKNSFWHIYYRKADTLYTSELFWVGGSD